MKLSSTNMSFLRATQQEGFWFPVDILEGMYVWLIGDFYLATEGTQNVT